LPFERDAMSARPLAELPRLDATDGSLFDARLFRVHFDNLPGPAYMWQRAGDDFQLIAYNRAAEALPFSRTGRFIGMEAGVLQAGTPHDMLSDLECCARTGTVLRRTVEHRYLGTGTLRRLATCLVPISDDIVVLHTDDITEREQTEAALRDSERQYRAIVDTAHEGILAVDGNGVVTYANHRIAEMLGYEPAHVVGQDVAALVDASHDEAAQHLCGGRVAGAKENFDARLRHRSGAVVWVSIASSPQVDPAGDVVGAIHMVSDISERKRAEQALQESEAKFRALVQAIPDVILRVTGDGRYIDVHCPDRQAVGCLPRALNEFVGRTVDELHAPQFAREHERHRRRALATGAVQLWEYVRRRDGDDRHIEARFVRSGPDEVVITLRDITRRVELEREVITTTERERARIGHDLHDGLAQLLIGVRLMLEAHADRLEAEGSAHGGDARRAAALMTDAVTQTGELAQGLSPIRKGVRFVDALRQLADQSQRLLAVECRVALERPPADLDEDTATHLYRIAQEAITNAVKHGNAAHVEIAFVRAGERYLLSIADDGTGIGDASEVGGMGMHTMLYRARSIGGELSVERRAAGGTIVKCYFPGARRASRGV
jgi:PAS domain S-box-containing protein